MENNYLELPEEVGSSFVQHYNWATETPARAVPRQASRNQSRPSSQSPEQSRRNQSRTASRCGNAQNSRLNQLYADIHECRMCLDLHGSIRCHHCGFVWSYNVLNVLSDLLTETKDRLNILKPVLLL